MECSLPGSANGRWFVASKRSAEDRVIFERATGREPNARGALGIRAVGRSRNSNGARPARALLTKNLGMRPKLVRIARTWRRACPCIQGHEEPPDYDNISDAGRCGQRSAALSLRK